MPLLPGTHQLDPQGVRSLNAVRMAPLTASVVERAPSQYTSSINESTGACLLSLGGKGLRAARRVTHAPLSALLLSAGHSMSTHTRW